MGDLGFMVRWVRLSYAIVPSTISIVLLIFPAISIPSPRRYPSDVFRVEEAWEVRCVVTFRGSGFGG